MHFGEGVKGPNIGLGTQGIRLKRPEKTSLVDAKGCNYYLLKYVFAPPVGHPQAWFS